MPDNDQLVRDEEQRKEAMADQQAVKDKLTAEVFARDKARLEAFHANKNATGLPLAPQEPARMDMAPHVPAERKQFIERGEKAIAGYQEAGQLAQRNISLHRGENPAEQALAAEKTFRQRQQNLADRINDPRTSSAQRERLELVKTIEYHTHKADQMTSIIDMHKDMAGYSFTDQAANQKAIDHHTVTRDNHMAQAAAAANKLVAFDQKHNRVPNEVQAQLGHAAQPPQQRDTQSQKDLASDPHLQAIADGIARQDTQQEQAKQNQESTAAKATEAPNPAAARLAARLQAARERNDATTTPELDARVQEIGACRDRLAAAQEMRKTEALGQKAELEQRAARHH